MPELPEVETTRRGVEPFTRGRAVRRVVVREPRLRWPVPQTLAASMAGQTVLAVERRAKYLLFKTAAGTALVHLGMSGSLRVVSPEQSPGKHDHIDIQLHNGACLRYNDPRRFGCFLWLEPAEQHPLLRELGPEPLSAEFDGELLHGRDDHAFAVVEVVPHRAHQPRAQDDVLQASPVVVVQPAEVTSRGRERTDWRVEHPQTSPPQSAVHEAPLEEDPGTCGGRGLPVVQVTPHRSRRFDDEQRPF